MPTVSGIKRKIQTSDSPDRIQIRDATPADFDAVLKLQRENHRDALSQVERSEWGFVGLISSKEDLARCLAEAAFLVADEEGTIVGYEFAYSIPHAKSNPFLAPEIEEYKRIPFDGKHVTDFNPCVLAQILIDKPQRGTTLAYRLHAAFLKRLKGRFGVLVSAVSPQNPRSMAFHAKIGMPGGYLMKHDGHEWLIPAQRIP